MIEKKTAVLFEVSCAMGAICAKRKQKDVKNSIVWKEFRNSIPNYRRSYWNYWRQ